MKNIIYIFFMFHSLKLEEWNKIELVYCDDKTTVQYINATISALC